MRPQTTISQADVRLRASLPVRAHWLAVADNVPPHDHTYHEICVLLDGSADHRTSTGDRMRVSAGTAIVMPPGAAHAFDDPQRLSVVNVYYLAEWLAADLSTLWGEEGLVPLFLSSSVIGPRRSQPAQFELTAEELARVTSDLRDIEAESAEHHPSAALIRGAFVKALVRLSRAAGRACLHCPAVRPEVWQAIDHIERLVATAEPLNVAALADRASMSSDYLGRLFRATMGRSPVDYYQLRRVQRACQLLGTPGWSATDVALELGYADAPHFSRMFKRYRGMSPSTYRATYATTAVAKVAR